MNLFKEISPTDSKTDLNKSSESRRLCNCVPSAIIRRLYSIVCGHYVFAFPILRQCQVIVNSPIDGRCGPHWTARPMPMSNRGRHWAEGQQCWSNNERGNEKQQHINKETKNSKTERSNKYNKYAKPREATQTGLVSAATLPSALFWDWIDKCNATTQYTDSGARGWGSGRGRRREGWKGNEVETEVEQRLQIGFSSWAMAFNQLFGGFTDWLCYVLLFLPSFLPSLSAPPPLSASSYCGTFWRSLRVLVHLGGLATNNAQPKWTM